MTKTTFVIYTAFNTIVRLTARLIDKNYWLDHPGKFITSVSMWWILTSRPARFSTNCLSRTIRALPASLKFNSSRPGIFYYMCGAISASLLIRYQPNNKSRRAGHHQATVECGGTKIKEILICDYVAALYGRRRAFCINILGQKWNLKHTFRCGRHCNSPGNPESQRDGQNKKDSFEGKKNYRTTRALFLK